LKEIDYWWGVFLSPDCDGLIASEYFADLHHREDKAIVDSPEKPTPSERQVSMAEFVSRSRSQKK